MKKSYLVIFSLLIILLLVIMSSYKKEKYENSKLYYFDNNATTFIYDPDVKEEITTWLSCGNPSNVLHLAGMSAKQKIDESRKMVADELNVKPENIYFTSGATEANNIAIQGLINYYLELSSKTKYTIMTTNIEHPSVLNIFNHYIKYPNPRLEVIIIPVQTKKSDEYYGSVDPADIEYAITNAKNKVILLSVMYANNETGAIQNMSAIGKIAQKHNIYLHCDATQAIGKYIIHPEKLSISAMAFSAHKFHGPKGIGCLYMKKPCEEMEGICYGGEQESMLRPGTENVASIAAMALALKKVHVNRDVNNKHLEKLRHYIKRELEQADCVIIEPKYKVLPNTLLVILKGIDICNKAFARALSDEMSICVGVSSACQTKHNSHVLDAMKVDEQFRDKIIRISMSDLTTYNECEYLVDGIKKMLTRYRNTTAQMQLAK